MGGEMRPRHTKLPLSEQSIGEFLKERHPYTLGQLMTHFSGTEEEVQYALFLGVQAGILVYFPPSRKIRARWGFDDRHKTGVAGPRISPLETIGELKYDIFSHAKLALRTRH
ncbi:MAG TPA: hypothetical protein VIY48_06105 [Candidatus Paceibacterota bacterium]